MCFRTSGIKGAKANQPRKATKKVIHEHQKPLACGFLSLDLPMVQGHSLMTVALSFSSTGQSNRLLLPVAWGELGGASLEVLPAAVGSSEEEEALWMPLPALMMLSSDVPCSITTPAVGSWDRSAGGQGDQHQKRVGPEGWR
mmetsp:Transcript_37593/g.107536  ORF Transcript_37593/g.107536 Transcript_37593/m.107536 type:complete len:142 (+) Transcript_37593:1643-2068(+)